MIRRSARQALFRRSTTEVERSLGIVLFRWGSVVLRCSSLMDSDLRQNDDESPSAGPSCFKVAFVGSHGVGKTTLCFELAAALKRRDLNVDVVKEVARQCPLPINQGTSFEAQSWILHTQIALEIESAGRHQVLVCDRSVLDNYAYFVTSLGRRREYDGLVSQWIRSYDRLFWVPILDTPSFDGVRDTDVRYQARVEELITELVGEFSVPVIQFHGHPREEWISIALNAIPQMSDQLPLFGGDAS